MRATGCALIFARSTLYLHQMVKVLTTVNAPYSRHLNAAELAHCLVDEAAAKTVPGHMSSFFGEVQPDLQVEFAAQHDISHAQLAAAAKAFQKYSGQSYPLAA
jgi:hypothetical protein